MQRLGNKSFNYFHLMKLLKDSNQTINKAVKEDFKIRVISNEICRACVCMCVVCSVI